MDELGEILREAREAKGLTLDDAFEETRITRKYLAAMEGGDYDQLPTPVHVRGYLRNYARFLGLDPTPLLERYENSPRKRAALPEPVTRREHIQTSGPLPVRDDQPFFDPVNVEIGAQSSGDGGGLIRLGIIAAAIFALALIAIRFVPILLGGDDGMTAIQDAVGDLLAGDDDAESEVATDDSTVLAATGEPAVETSRNEGASVDVATDIEGEENDLETVELPEPEPTRPQLPAVIDNIALRVDILERTWIRITVDGEVQFQGQAVSGDLFEYNALQEVTIDCGNCIGALVTINDLELGRMGTRGEAASETWRTNAGG